MKEAAGEANMTVVTIILITAIVAVVTPIVMNAIGNAGKRTCCTNKGYIFDGGKCYNVDSTTGKRGAEVQETDYWNKDSKECA